MTRDEIKVGMTVYAMLGDCVREGVVQCHIITDVWKVVWFVANFSQFESFASECDLYPSRLSLFHGLAREAWEDVAKAQKRVIEAIEMVMTELASPQQPSGRVPAEVQP